MPRGYEKPLYLLPFDHRGSLQSKLFGWTSPLSSEQTGAIATAKGVVYDGFKAALAAGVPRERAGILVDEQFGEAILRDASAAGITTACSVEKSGQREFEFEYGEAFARHIDAIRPTFAKVLVRYNPHDDPAMNQRQAARLRVLSDHLAARQESLFMFELLVPATQAQLAAVNGDALRYDRETRPQLMADAIGELQSAGVEPDLWKIEGLDRREDCEAMVSAVRAGGRRHVSCIVLGRGATESRVREWLGTAARVDGFIGFAIGRTVFWEPLKNWRQGTLTRDEAVAEIGRRYSEFVGVFETSRASPA